MKRLLLAISTLGLIVSGCMANRSKDTNMEYKMIGTPDNYRSSRYGTYYGIKSLIESKGYKQKSSVNVVLYNKNGWHVDDYHRFNLAVLSSEKIPFQILSIWDYGDVRVVRLGQNLYKRDVGVAGMEVVFRDLEEVKERLCSESSMNMFAAGVNTCSSMFSYTKYINNAGEYTRIIDFNAISRALDSVEAELWPILNIYHDKMMAEKKKEMDKQYAQARAAELEKQNLELKRKNYINACENSATVTRKCNRYDKPVITLRGPMKAVDVAIDSTFCLAKEVKVDTCMIIHNLSKISTGVNLGSAGYDPMSRDLNLECASQMKLMNSLPDRTVTVSCEAAANLIQ